jgi:hypothetical protein
LQISPEKEGGALAQERVTGVWFDGGGRRRGVEGGGGGGGDLWQRDKASKGVKMSLGTGSGEKGFFKKPVMAHRTRNNQFPMVTEHRTVTVRCIPDRPHDGRST